VSFVPKAEKSFRFDENGDPPAIYDLVNWQTDDDGQMHLKTVGSFNSTSRLGQQLFINTSAIQWNEDIIYKVKITLFQNGHFRHTSLLSIPDQ